MCRLESLGFRQAYDDVAGIADWVAFGLPREGTEAGVSRVGDVARRDVPTCGLTDTLGGIREQLRAVGWNTCLVVGNDRAVLGRLRAAELVEADPTAPAGRVMAAGPGTVRPDARVEEVAGRMRDKHVATMVVTTPDGRLVGLFRLQGVKPTADRRD